MKPSGSKRLVLIFAYALAIFSTGLLLGMLASRAGGWQKYLPYWITGTLVTLLAMVGYIVHARVREINQALLNMGKSERRYRDFFNAATEAILVLALPDGELLHVNKTMLEMFGYESEAEVLSMDINDLGTGELSVTQPNMRTKISEAVKEGPLTFEWRAQRKTGEVFWAEVLLRHMETGGEGQVLAVVRDISRRKQIEQSLREREQQYRTLVEQIPAIVYIDNVSGDGVESIYISPQVGVILGIAPEEWLEKSPQIWHNLVHVDDSEFVHVKYTRCVENGEPFQAEYRMQTADGRLLWFHDQAVLLRDENGNPWLVNGLMQDITDRKAAEEEMHRRVTELETIYENGLAINQLLDPAAIGQKVIELLRRKLDWHHTTIRLYHPYDESLELLAFNQPGLSNETERRKVAERFNTLVAHAGQGVSGWAVRYKQAVRSNDLSKDSRYVDTYPGLQSGLYVPMMIGERVVGVISIESERPGAFSEADERLTITLANQAASALENARLFEQTKRRVEEFAALYDTSRILSGNTDLNAMLKAIAEYTRKLLGASSSGIYLYFKESGELVLTMDVTPHPIAGTRIKTGEGAAGYVAQTCQPLRLDNYSAWENRSPKYEGVEFYAVLGVPMLYGGELIGVLMAGETDDPRRKFTEADEHLLSLLASQAAGAIHSARLREQTARRLDQLQSLHTIDRAISSSFELRPILNMVIAQAVAQLQVDAADVLLYNPHLQVLDYFAGQGFRSRAIKQTHLRLGECFSGRAALERRTVHIANLPGAASGFTRAEMLKDEKFLELYAVPLIAKGQVKGVLEVFHRTTISTNPDWLDFLETIAKQAAITIEQTQLFENLQRANIELIIAYDATIEGWARAMDLRDKETENHTERVTELTISLARAMGVQDSGILNLKRGALLHDIGKIGVPDNILLKEGTLTDDEWIVMRRHPQFARDMLYPITYLRQSLDIPYCHHEKWDGTGYPRGLKGEEIPLAARIFAIADVWDAVTSDRPYRKAWTNEEALSYIREQSGKQFDPKVVEAFLKLISS